jgi:hypothetical protein
MESYTTMQACRVQLQNSGATLNTSEDAVIDSYRPPASQIIADYCGQGFTETLRTINYSPRLGAVDLSLAIGNGIIGGPLISLTTLTNGDGSVVPSASINLYPSSEYPKRRLVLSVGFYWMANPTQASYAVYDDPDAMYMRSYAASGEALVFARSYFANSYAVNGISLAGIWSFNQQGPAAWVPTGLTLGGNTLAGATSLTLSAAIGTAFDVGSNLKIDSEYFVVTGPIINTAMATSVTVFPANNGSTAAPHSNGATIYVYRVEPTVELATRMMVAALYQGRNNATGDALMIDGAVMVAPSALPKRVRELLPTPYYNVLTGGRVSD